jgi:hypothetical protein
MFSYEGMYTGDGEMRENQLNEEIEALAQQNSYYRRDTKLHSEKNMSSKSNQSSKNTSPFTEATEIVHANIHLNNVEHRKLMLSYMESIVVCR